MAAEPTPHTGYIRFIPGPRLMRWMGRVHTQIYRLTGGRIGAHVDRLDILLLTTTGRKSGEQRTSPLPYFRDGDRFVVVGSNGGSDRHPAWVLNLRENPRAELQVGPECFSALGHAAQGEERERLWKEVTARQPRYDDYQQTTERPIQLMVFERLDADPENVG